MPARAYIFSRKLSSGHVCCTAHQALTQHLVLYLTFLAPLIPTDTPRYPDSSHRRSHKGGLPPLPARMRQTAVPRCREDRTRCIIGLEQLPRTNQIVFLPVPELSDAHCECRIRPVFIKLERPPERLSVQRTHGFGEIVWVPAALVVKLEAETTGPRGVLHRHL